MASKRALVTGITGQDGCFLAKLLLEKGYEVWGGIRRSSDNTRGRLRMLGIDQDIKPIALEMSEYENIRHVIEKAKPDEVYNLAAQSYVGVSFEQPLFTADITGLGVLRLLEAIRHLNVHTKLYQASSSEMFGDVLEMPQTEKTPFNPMSPYACSKVFAHQCCVNYRKAYEMFICCGMLWNHESIFRGHEFVTRKITSSVARIVHGKLDCLMLGNLESQRDWGHSPDFIEAMYLMMQQSQPDDYVVATGEMHTVKEFVEHAFAYANILIEWSGSGQNEIGIDKCSGKTVVAVDPANYRPSEVNKLLGDATKAKEILGWSPKTKFKELVALMVEHDLMREGNGL